MTDTASIQVLSPDGIERSSPSKVIVEGFLARLDSPNTRRAYRRHIEAALAFFAVEPWNVTGADLARYRAHLIATTTASAAKQAIAALRSFFGWCRKSHVAVSPLSSDCIEDALEMTRANVQKPYDVLDDAELAKLLSAATSARDRALIGILAGSGLRISEALGLDVTDIKPRNGTPHGALWIRQGKGQKDRVVPMTASVSTSVNALADELQRKEGPLFVASLKVTHKTKVARMSAWGATKVLRGMLERAGITRQISPHSLRHTCAIRLLHATNSNVAQVKRLLGHSSIAVTSRYLDHVDTEELGRVMPDLPTGR